MVRLTAPALRPTSSESTMRIHPFLIAPALAAGAVAQNPCVDQSFVPSPVNNGLEITANQTVTQTFTVRVPGTLAQIDVVGINHHRGTPTQPLEVRVVATDPNGVPSGATLASVTLQPAQVPAQRGRLPLDLRPFAISVARGQVLGLRLSSNAQPGGQTYAWWGEVPGTYDRGQIFVRDTTALSAWDLSFETFVSSPPSWSGYGTGHAGTNGVPSISLSANPALGSTPDIVVGNSRGAATQGALLAGFGRSNQATPFGGTLLVQIGASVTVNVPAGGAVLPQPVPNDPNLCGVDVNFQIVLVDPGASHGLSFTGGLELRLGT